MNSIVALGDSDIIAVAAAYGGGTAGAVWTLEASMPPPAHGVPFRPLETVLEPFMASYFAGESERDVAALRSRLAALDFHLTADAAAAALRASLGETMATVTMLDRADAIHPVELVLTGNTTLMERTAVAWARARAVPVIVPAGPRPAGRAGFAALAPDGSHVPVVPAAGPGSHVAAGAQAARRVAARASIAKALGWEPADVIVFFEPASAVRESALEPNDAFEASLTAMFAAFVVARERIPALRLVVVAQAFPGGCERAEAAADATGLTARDFAYADSNREVWLAGSDIVVSVESPRSLDAAREGLPAVNLWRPVNWYRGPAFAAEDGVIDASPAMLAPTLVALAGDAALRAQIAAIATGRHAGLASPVPAAVAAGLRFHRRDIAAPAVKTRPDILIFAPDYRHDSAGVRALHRLCHLINICGGDATIFPATGLHSGWRTPRRARPLSERTIVVYPETAERALNAGRVVRWVLNEPGLLAGPTSYPPDEMVFYWSQGIRAHSQAATSEPLTDERQLELFTIDPELFFNDRSAPRLYDCVYIGKGRDLYERTQPAEIRDALIIRGGEKPWPATRAETAALLRGCRRVYSFDGRSAIAEESVLCGARFFYVREGGELEEYIGDLSAYAWHYYDLSQVERFLRQLENRWE